MSRFYGTIEGQAKTAASRHGSPKSGIQANINGWDTGILVELSELDGKDYWEIYLTGGSNDATRHEHIAVVIQHKDGRREVETFDAGD